MNNKEKFNKNMEEISNLRKSVLPLEIEINKYYEKIYILQEENKKLEKIIKRNGE